MNKLSDWSLAQKLQDSKCRGIVIGVTIALAIVVVVAAIIIKIHWMKKHLGCCHDRDIFEDDFMDDDCCGEDGCCIASEKDFV